MKKLCNQYWKSMFQQCKNHATNTKQLCFNYVTGTEKLCSNYVTTTEMHPHNYVTSTQKVCNPILRIWADMVPQNPSGEIRVVTQKSEYTKSQPWTATRKFLHIPSIILSCLCLDRNGRRIKLCRFSRALRRCPGLPCLSTATWPPNDSYTRN